MVENRAEVSIRAGVTIIEPRPASPFEPCFAAVTYQRNGETTGLEWIRESGLLSTPIAPRTRIVSRSPRCARRRRAHSVGGSQYCACLSCWKLSMGTERHMGAVCYRDARSRGAGAGDERTGREGSVGGGTGMVA